MLEKKPVIKRALGETFDGRPVKRIRIAMGSETSSVLARTLGAHGENVELHHNSPRVAKKKFLWLKIANMLFPENFPKPVGVNGNILYARYVGPHAELKDFQKYWANTSERGNEYYEKADRMVKKFNLHEKDTSELNERLNNAGIFTDSAETNWAILKGRLVSYEARVNTRKLRMALPSMKIQEARKKAILKLVEQYEKIFIQK